MRICYVTFFDVENVELEHICWILFLEHFGVFQLKISIGLIVKWKQQYFPGYIREHRLMRKLAGIVYQTICICKQSGRSVVLYLNQSYRS